MTLVVPIVVLVAGLAIGLTVIAIVSHFENDNRRPERPHGRRRRTPSPSRTQHRHYSPPPSPRRKPTPSSRTVNSEYQPSPSPSRAVSPSPSEDQPSPSSSRPDSPMLVSDTLLRRRNINNGLHVEKCSNCFLNRKLVIFLPCRHSYFCKSCTLEFLGKTDNCSMCPSIITGLELAGPTA